MSRFFSSDFMVYFQTYKILEILNFLSSSSSFFSSMKILQRPENHYFLLFQIKLCGICCLASAVLCVVVTVTTTVIHMNRLQTLRECVYQGSIQTCTCFAGFFDPTMSHHDGNNNNWTFAGKNLRHLGKL